MGFGTSRPEARQLVRHGHFTVNGRKVNIPSFLVKPGDVISIKEGSRSSSKIKDVLEITSSRAVPKWLDLDRNTLAAKVLNLAERDDIDLIFTSYCRVVFQVISALEAPCTFVLLVLVFDLNLRIEVRNMIEIESRQLNVLNLVPMEVWKICGGTLERGYASLLATHFCRIYNIPSRVATSIKIGVLHEFSTIPGLKRTFPRLF